jgi:hypothetical protein
VALLEGIQYGAAQAAVETLMQVKELLMGKLLLLIPVVVVEAQVQAVAAALVLLAL